MCAVGPQAIRILEFELKQGFGFGPNIMAVIVFMFFATLSLASIRNMFGMYWLESVSRTTMMNALSVVATQKFAAPMSRISHRLKDPRFLMTDAMLIKIRKTAAVCGCS